MRKHLAAAAAIGLLLHAAPASAHAFLKAAEPPVGGTIRQSPAQMVITFTEGVEPDFSGIAVQDASGAPVRSGVAHRQGDDQHLAADLPPLAPGTYKVIWHATAIDTHKTQGDFSFTVAP